MVRYLSSVSQILYIITCFKLTVKVHFSFIQVVKSRKKEVYKSFNFTSSTFNPSPDDL